MLNDYNFCIEKSVQFIKHRSCDVKMRIEPKINKCHLFRFITDSKEDFQMLELDLSNDRYMRPFLIV